MKPILSSIQLSQVNEESESQNHQSQNSKKDESLRQPRKFFKIRGLKSKGKESGSERSKIIDKKNSAREEESSQSELSKRLNEQSFASAASTKLIKFIEPEPSSSNIEQQINSSCSEPSQVKSQRRVQYTTKSSLEEVKEEEEGEEANGKILQLKSCTENTQTNTKSDAHETSSSLRGFDQLSYQTCNEADILSSRQPSRQMAKQHYAYIAQMKKLDDVNKLQIQTGQRRRLDESHVFGAKNVPEQDLRDRLTQQRPRLRICQQPSASHKSGNQSLKSISEKNSIRSLRIESQKSEVRPYRRMKFMKKNRSKMLQFAVYRERDVLQLDNQLSHLLNNNLCEQQQDDDVDTDEEVLCSGI